MAIVTQTRKRLLYGFLIGCLVGLIVAAMLFYTRQKVQNFEPMARARIIQALEQRFDADVELKYLQISLYPRPKATGDGLVIRHKGWNDPYPVISIRRFIAATDYDTVIARKNHVDLVRLEGLEIHIPPRGRSALIQTNELDHAVAGAQPGQDTTRFRFDIQTIIADDALLEIEPRVEGKPPLKFDIRELTLHSIASDQAMTFTAKLMNAKPPGLISSQGRFGPWQKDDPRATAVSGNYVFQNANLGVFRGISGSLSSSGNYHGVLQHIEVDGDTDTPNFALKRGGNFVHLTTKFHSIVNGTDGDTILDPVDARFLRSDFDCRGGIVHQPGSAGKTVSLNAVAPHARIEDILRLVMGGKPILTGNVFFQSKIVIPPGHEDVLNKLQLDGRFTLSSGEFTSLEVEQRLETLSARARGISKTEEESQAPQNVASNLEAQFKLSNSIASFAVLKFSVPGAAISLNGQYNLETQQIDMNGLFRMQATLSETQSGIKRWVLKPFDRFFEKDGAGFEAPITIGGTREHPALGIDVFHRHITIH